jgi:acetyltransferase
VTTVTGEHPKALDAFFAPRGLALVGASRDRRKLGYIILQNLLEAGYEGRVHAVNLAGEGVLGQPAYRSVSDVPDPVDLAVVVVPAPAIPAVIDECGARGIRAVLVISAGFREAGPRGAVLERELHDRAARHGIRIIGPNSVGLINTGAKLNATFAETQPLSYDVALISQSGAVATAILDWARTTGVGFSKFASLGNMVDISEVDMLEYLADDPSTRVVISYIEGFSDGRRFIDAAKRVTAQKPLVAMKVGRSEAGARAAASHTGALAAADAVVGAALRQAGVVRAETMDELFDLTMAFAYLPLPRGPRIAVLTNAGGPGVMAADAAEKVGLTLASISPDTQERLRAVLPPQAATGNPVDVLGDARPERYRAAIEPVLADEGVDALVVLLTPQAMTRGRRTAQVIIEAARGQAKPVVAAFMGGDAVAGGRLVLDKAQIPAFHYPERAVRALARLWEYGRYRDGA